MLLLLNAAVILIVAAPLMILELLCSHSRWVERHHEGLGFIVWFITLLGVYTLVLPRLGLQPNWRVLAP
jgi:hypothetical protein